MWKEKDPAGRAAQIQAAIAAAVACERCPHITPETGLEILLKAGAYWPTGTPVRRAQADALVADESWRTPALAWIGAYNTAHGHGPTWHEFFTAPELWPEEVPMVVRRAAVPALWRAGHIGGERTPFGLRARTPSQRRSLLKARQKHAEPTAQVAATA